MKTHRQGRTGAASAVSDTAHARRLLKTLRLICRRLGEALPDRGARPVYREVAKALARLARDWPVKRSTRKQR